MSSIIEAQAYTQNFSSSDVTVTNSNTHFQAFVALLVITVIAALAGIAFSAPIITITAGATTVVAAVYAAFTAITHHS